MLTDEELMLACFADAPPVVQPKKLIIRVFTTDGARQNIAFTAALTKCMSELSLSTSNMSCEIINVGFFKFNHQGPNNTHLFYTPEMFVKWLLRSHVHFIVTHPNQGQRYWAQHQRWNLDTLRLELQKLKFHTGYPSGENVECPMFTQNKYEYIGPLMSSGVVNETLRIDLSLHVQEEHILK